MKAERLWHAVTLWTQSLPKVACLNTRANATTVRAARHAFFSAPSVNIDPTRNIPRHHLEAMSTAIILKPHPRVAGIADTVRGGITSSHRQGRRRTLETLDPMQHHYRHGNQLPSMPPPMRLPMPICEHRTCVKPCHRQPDTPTERLRQQNSNSCQ